jgi:asparagine synthase (glutamine-hydrolysing)
MSLRGASPETVRRARDRADPLPGTGGFAGELDGALVRDVLGRELLFYDSTGWSHDPRGSTEGRSLPAGHVLAREDGDADPRRLWSLPEPEPAGSGAVDRLREALETTLDPLGQGASEHLAVGFSGGVDSSVLAARWDAPLYTVGFPDSHDVAAARSGAEALGADLTVVELDHDRLEAAIPRVVDATGRTNAMDVAIALPILVLARRVAADGYERLALGQAADELFGGYAKVENAPDDHRVDADTVRGARRETLASLPDQFERDILAVRSAAVEPVTPFAHDRVVRAALALDGDQLVRDGRRKWALREAVRPWLPDSLLDRPKKALQYGSLVSRELDRLARQAGYKRRMDDHVRRYVESLC